MTKYSKKFGKRTVNVYFNPYVKKCKRCGSVGKIVTARTWNPKERRIVYQNWCQGCGIEWTGNKQYSGSPVKHHSVSRQIAEPWDKKMRNRIRQKKKLEYIQRKKIKRIPRHKYKRYNKPNGLGFYF